MKVHYDEDLASHIAPSRACCLVRGRGWCRLASEPRKRLIPSADEVTNSDGNTHRRLEGRSVVPASPLRHSLSCSAAIIAAFRQKFRLSHGADFPGHLCDGWRHRRAQSPTRFLSLVRFCRVRPARALLFQCRDNMCWTLCRMAGFKRVGSCWRDLGRDGGIKRRASSNGARIVPVQWRQLRFLRKYS